MSASTNGAALSRRGFLAGTGGALAMFALAACTPGGAAGSGKEYSLLLPGVAPTGNWNGVLAALNKKLQADKGFTIKPEFINWTNYPTQSVLKFTSGEKFQTALSARWLNMQKLVASKAIVGLSDKLNSGQYSNITKTVSKRVIDSNLWDGQLYGIPAVNTAARVINFTVRGDLVDKYAHGELADYDALEKFWYDIKQHESGMTPYVDSGNSALIDVIGSPTASWTRAAWENPNRMPVGFSNNSILYFPALDATKTGSANLVPFYEDQNSIDSMKLVRKYYQDGIINADALNTDAATRDGLFNQGGAATVWAITDGTATSSHLPLLKKAVPNASVMTVLPFRDGKKAKPNQTFQADNQVVVNARGDVDAALELIDWVSIKENHDLLQYGIEGTDWKAVGDTKYRQVSDYNGFPGYALSWRVPLERRSTDISESEAGWLDWAQDYNNFTTDPFATFIPDLTPVQKEDAQVQAALVQYGLPLAVGAVDVDKGLSDLKKAVDTAGADKVREELEKQANAYLKKQKK
ncbi:ABC transporter substrate-binding protein [Leifsonia shinshuensis]|uniref:ABC transporter substrate-binding protein n=1 Tax=Leifsonia shinshuensis TaxID=150026 RepID=A0A7G6YAB9_9MICO|nr:ABC transporter substrate-binding protein [Leifsonia shinshuensis]QNE35434.1 ABC transporter substrate-binding protein [Leifsonia shinshuensis]